MSLVGFATVGNHEMDRGIEFLRRPVGDRICPDQVRINGRPLRLGARYRIATLANNFFAKNASPGFTALFDARHQHRSTYNGGDALWRYLEARSPVSAPPANRMAPA